MEGLTVPFELLLFSPCFMSLYSCSKCLGSFLFWCVPLVCDMFCFLSGFPARFFCVSSVCCVLRFPALCAPHVSPVLWVGKALYFFSAVWVHLFDISWSPLDHLVVLLLLGLCFVPALKQKVVFICGLPEFNRRWFSFLPASFHYPFTFGHLSQHIRYPRRSSQFEFIWTAIVS